ncbi:hypothetical protein [Methanobrevibacter sp. UBA212]|uniref:hypothetical protein n=1 Tax=Methanobrevibacter sp. UBA212 TaxID=1915476 RepID=UPI0025EEFA91|nr:hypothetical protein [Methanobrevibacter sp. UBA212]
METKKIIIIGILLVIICILFGAIFGLLTSNVAYERIEITPNGTSIEVPSEDAKYDGEINNTGAKMWTFKQGALMTFNSAEAIDARGLNGLGGAVGFKDIKDIVITHFEKQETIDGFTVYTLNGEQLGINGRGTMYCIITGNDQTHDNILITVDNKDIALHMAKSIQYKTGNITSNTTTSDGYTNSNNLSSAPTNANKTPSNNLVKPDTSTSSDGYDNTFSDDDISEISSSTSSDSSSSSSSSSSSDVETSTDDASSSSSSSSNTGTSTG